MELRSLSLDHGIHLPQADAALAVAGLIGCVGDAAFGRRGIEQINRAVPLCWWSVYRLLDDAPPVWHLGGCLDAEDCLAASWRSYVGGLYRRDRSFDGVREHGDAHSGVMTHLHAMELPKDHRQRIYSRHGLAERLSLVCRDGDAGLLAVNLYRHVDQPAFSDGERDTLQQLGAMLLACVARHLAVGPNEASSPALACLGGREREVCDRLLRGWTHDGIAADLQLSATTVKTYRDRAFERLGIHHRSELFALAMQGARTGR